MNTIDLFREASETPTVWRMDATTFDLDNAIFGWIESGFVVRTVRGSRMRSVQALYDELAAAFQFPQYFGQNMNALNEFVQDLEWLPSRGGYVMVMTDPHEILVDDPSGNTADIFIGVLLRAKRAWATPVTVGEKWDHPALPFNIVLARSTVPAETVAIWEKAGATMKPLEQPW